MLITPKAVALRHNLLELHRAIVNFERRDYERRAGEVGAAAFLRVLIEDQAYAWLRPLSILIVQLDEDTERPAAEIEAALFDETRALLKIDPAGTPFESRYAWLIEQSPEVAYAHGGVMQALKQK
ncbi:MAG TPA: hypothetical protein VGI18_10570 [Burkholderiales bacterium]|jgi:hypothetical protein